VDGNVEADAQFNVLVNGAVRGQLKADETLLIQVAPYDTYDVELRAVGETLVNLDNRIFRETMYPVNVVNLSWSTQVINIAIGRLVDESGKAIDSAVIQNVVGIAMTDDHGFFKVEINQETDSLIVQRGGQRCESTFENPRSIDTVVMLGTLLCQ